MVLPFQDGQDGRSANLSVFFFAALMSSEFWHCWQSHPLSSRNAVFQMAWLAGKQNCAGVVEGFFCTLETCKTMGSLLRNDWCWRLLDALGVHNFWKPLVAPVAWCCLMSDVDANKISLMLIREYHFLSLISIKDILLGQPAESATEDPGLATWPSFCQDNRHATISAPDNIWLNVCGRWSNLDTRGSQSVSWTAHAWHFCQSPRESMVLWQSLWFA